MRAPRSTTSIVSAMVSSVSPRRCSQRSPPRQHGDCGEQGRPGMAQRRSRGGPQPDGHRREAGERGAGEHGDRSGRVAVQGRPRDDQRHPDGEEGHRRHVPRGVEHGLRRARTAEAAGGQHRGRQLAHHEDLASHPVHGGSNEGEGSGGDQRGIHGRAPIHTVVYGWSLAMSAPTRTPRSSWIDEGLRALAAGGPDAVRIEPLAQSLGVTKGGFYWHFDDRRALLEEMLDTWEREGVDVVIERVEAEPGDARAKLRRLFALARSSGDVLKIDLAVRDWARREKTVAERLRRIDNRRMAYMRALFGPICSDGDEVEARCMVAFSLWIGNHFIAADHGPRSRAEVLELALGRLEA